MKEIKIVIKIPEFKLSKLKDFILNKLRYVKIQMIRALKRVKQDIISKKIYTILLILIFGFLLWKLGIEAVILWIIFLAFLFYKWENRILAVVALFFLVSCPILLIFKKEAAAEQMAIYAYYFLIMTVVLQIIEYWKKSRNIKEVNVK